MPPNNNDETVSDILKRKQGRIKNAPLPPGSPSWDDILDLTWAEIKERAVNHDKGFKTFRKLLSDPEYDK
jgi:hypothetical protein